MDRGTLAGESEQERLKRENSILREALRRAENLVAIAPAFFGYLNPKGAILDFNDRALEVIEAQRDQLVGVPFWEAPWWEPVQRSAEKVREAVQDAAKGKSASLELEYRAVQNGSGALRWLTLAITPLHDSEGHLSLLAATGIDVTERRNSEQALRQQERLLDAILAHLPAAVQVKDLDGRYIIANPRAKKLKSPSMIGKTDYQLLPTAVADTITERDREVLAGGKPVESDEEVLGGPTRTALLAVKFPIPGDDGKPVALGEIATDITERKWLEHIAESERRALERTARGATFELVLAGLIDAIENLGAGMIASILVVDEDGKRLRNGASSPALPPEVVLITDGFAIGPQGASCGTAVYLKKRIVVRDIARDPLWVDYRHLVLSHGLRACWSTPVFNARGEVLGTFAVYYRQAREPDPSHLRIVDRLERTVSVILERQRQEAERARLIGDLEAANARYQSLFEGSAESSLVVAPDGRYLDANRAAQQLTGYSLQELRRMRVGDLHFGKEQVRAAWPRIVADGRWSGEEEVRRKDAGLVPVETRVAAVYLSGGLSYVATMRDISERRALERLRRDFLAVVGHELRNPLNSIGGSAALMRATGQFNERALDRIVRQTRQLERIIGDLQETQSIEAGQLKLRRQSVDLLPLLKSCVEEAAAIAQAHAIRLEADAQALPGIWDGDRVCQVLRNLLSNAIKYSPDGGEVLVKVAQDEAELRVSVIDRGPGIAKEQLPRLFERYWRAPEQQKAAPGMGVGLFVSRELVEKHGGKLLVESEPGRGSTFTMRLPRQTA